jgi:hypothetical protein
MEEVMRILRALEVTHLYFGTNLRLFGCRGEERGGASHTLETTLISSYCMLRRNCEILGQSHVLALDNLMGHCP